MAGVFAPDLDGWVFFGAEVDADGGILFAGGSLFLGAGVLELDGGGSNVSGTAFFVASVVELRRSTVLAVGGVECGGE